MKPTCDKSLTSTFICSFMHNTAMNSNGHCVIWGISTGARSAEAPRLTSVSVDIESSVPNINPNTRHHRYYVLCYYMCSITHTFLHFCSFMHKTAMNSDWHDVGWGTSTDAMSAEAPRHTSVSVHIVGSVPNINQNIRYHRYYVLSLCEVLLTSSFTFCSFMHKQPWIQTDMTSAGAPRPTRCQLRHLNKHPAISSDWHCVGWVTSTDAMSTKAPRHIFMLKDIVGSVQYITPKHSISLYLFLCILYVKKYSHDFYCSFL